MDGLLMVVCRTLGQAGRDWHDDGPPVRRRLLLARWRVIILTPIGDLDARICSLIVSGLVIGDSLGGTVSDVVRLLANDQIIDTAAVTVANSGLLDLNGFSDMFAHLIVTSGDTSGASVTTGNGTLGLGGNLRVTVFNTGAMGAIINGNLSLVGNHSFDVADGTATQDLTITAAISGPGSLNKIGDGSLRFSGTTANTYAGATKINAGTLELGKPAGLNAIVGNLVIGENVGRTDVLRLLAGDQVANSATVTVNTSGFLDLNGFTDTFALLNYFSGNTGDDGPGKVGSRRM